MNYRASRVTRFELDEARTLLSADTLTVFCIIFSNGHSEPAEIDLTDGAGNKKITIIVPANDSRVIDCEWVADGGIKLPTLDDANVVVTIFHSAVSS